jgi:DNA-binding response OmpR family regulator
MTHERILIIEDESASLDVLTEAFSTEGYNVQSATDGEDGLEKALNQAPDLLVLDIMLPKVDGFEICRLLREEELDLPILMLTASGSEADVVRGLNLGADDYVTKPFRIRELLARANALLRRRRREAGNVLRVGSFVLDETERRIWKDGAEIALTRREFDLLAFLVKHPRRVLTRAVILRHVWGYEADVTDRNVDRWMTTLRRKIEPDPHEPTYVKAVRAIGYRFEPGDGGGTAS